MIILAWIAVVVPVLLFLSLITHELTDGFTDWEALLPLVMGAVMLGFIASVTWGIGYIIDHPAPPKPIIENLSR